MPEAAWARSILATRDRKDRIETTHEIWNWFPGDLRLFLNLLRLKHGQFTARPHDFAHLGKRFQFPGAARTCESRFPNAVVSAGPATTRRRHLLAVN